MRRFKMRLVFLMLVTIVVVGSAGVGIGIAQTGGQTAPPKHFKLEGTVKSVDAQNHKLVVDHKEIPGFMRAMTMPYNVKKEEDLTKVSAGDQIAADVVVSADEGRYLENVKVTGHAAERPTEKPAENKDKQ
jgi:protein SCO1